VKLQTDAKKTGAAYVHAGWQPTSQHMDWA